MKPTMQILLHLSKWTSFSVTWPDFLFLKSIWFIFNPVFLLAARTKIPRQVLQHLLEHLPQKRSQNLKIPTSQTSFLQLVFIFFCQGIRIIHSKTTTVLAQVAFIAKKGLHSCSVKQALPSSQIQKIPLRFKGKPGAGNSPLSKGKVEEDTFHSNYLQA